MAYDSQTGETSKTQKGGVFETGTQQGVTSATQKGGVLNTGSGNTVGVTGEAQRGGVFDGVVLVEGTPGPQGPAGPAGPTGPSGPSGTIAVGTTTTLPPNSQATVTDTGTPSAAIFNFGIPQGPQGQKGDPGATINITASATATTLATGAPATATVTTSMPDASTENLAFALGIPQGPQGPAGPAGPALTVGTVTTTTGAAGTQANVNITEPVDNQLDFAFTIPTGPAGPAGPAGPQGPTGISITGVTASATQAGNLVTVTLNETFSSGPAQQTQFQFNAGGGTGTNIFFNTVDPDDPLYTPPVVPALYMNTITRTLWLYPNAAAGWLEVEGGETLISSKGTITVTGEVDGYDINIAQNGATDLQKLTWNAGANNWQPKSTVITSGAVANNLTVTVDGQSAVAHPVQSVALGIENTNQLVATVNGVASQPVTLPTPTFTGVTKVIAGTNIQISPSTGVGDVTISATDTTGLTSVVLHEPAWRTVTPVTAGNIETITVTDNNQDANKFFAGLNFIQLQLGWSFSTNTLNATSAGALDISTTGILGLRGSVNVPFSTGANLATVITNTLNALIVDNTRWNIAGSWNNNYTAISLAYTGTSSPFTSPTFTMLSSNSWAGGSSIVVPNSVGYPAQVNGAPQFRRITPDDILPAISGTPADGQLVTWDAMGNTSKWANAPITSTTTVTQGNGITVTDSGTGNNHAYTVAAALTAQDAGVAVTGTYSAINLGNNLTGTISGGILTINATGGGGEGPYIFNGLSASATQPAAVPYWDTTTNGTGTVSLNISETNANGYTVGPTFSINPAATSGSNPFVVASSRAGISYVGSVTGTGRGTDNTTTPFSGNANAVTVTQTTYTPAFFTQTANGTNPAFDRNSPNKTAGNAAGSQFTYPTATAMTQYNWIATQRPLAAIALKTPFGNNPLTADVNTTITVEGQTFNLFGWTRLAVGGASTVIIS